MIPLAIYCNVTVTWHIIEAIIPLLLLFILTFGVGMILTTINVFFRDMEYIWEVLLMLIMYSSAIFYYPERLNEQRVCVDFKMESVVLYDPEFS